MMMRRSLAAVVLLSLSACGSEKTDILFECPSADGSLIATVYRVSHGDREYDRETKLNLRPAASAFDDAMFSFSIRHGYDAIIRWSAADKLEFTYPLDSELLHVENVIFGTSQTFDASQQISVNYRQELSTHGYFMVEKRCFSGAP